VGVGRRRIGRAGIASKDRSNFRAQAISLKGHRPLLAQGLLDLGVTVQFVAGV